MDSRFPTHYLNDRRILRLSSEAFRLYVVATAWCVSNKTDGAIDRADLPLIPFATESEAARLVESELWEEYGNGWQVTDYSRTQTSAAQMEASLENRRKADAERQRKKRARDREESVSSGPTAATSPSPNQSSRDAHVSFEGKAEARQGKAEARTKNTTTNESLNESTGELTSEDPWTSSMDDHVRCSIPGCSRPVTDYTRKTYGQFCAPCGEKNTSRDRNAA